MTVSNELRELASLKDWTAEVFGDLINYLETWLNLERVYVKGLDTMLETMNQRKACYLPSVEAVWDAHIKDLCHERDIRKEAVHRIEKKLNLCISMEEKRLRDVKRHFKKLESRYETMKKSDENAQLCLTRLEEVHKPETTKQSRFSGRLPIKSKSKSKPAESFANVEMDMYQADKNCRAAIYHLNDSRLAFAAELEELVSLEQNICENVKSVFRYLGDQKHTLSQTLSPQGSSQVARSTNINALFELSARTTAVSEKLVAWDEPLHYTNPWFNNSCRYIIFGVPLATQTTRHRHDPWNPEPYDVLQVLIRATRRKNVPISSSRPNTASSAASSSSSLHTLSANEHLFAIERAWDKTSRSASYEMVKKAAIEPYKVLAHFFSMLPEPFIPLSGTLLKDIGDAFSTHDEGRYQDIITRVWASLEGEAEQEILAQLCEIFQNVPAEAGKRFAEPLTHKNQPWMQSMLFQLFMDWRAYEIATAAMTRMQHKRNANNDSNAIPNANANTVRSTSGSSLSHYDRDRPQMPRFQERTFTSGPGNVPYQIESHSQPNIHMTSPSTSSFHTQPVNIASYPPTLAPSSSSHLSVSPPSYARHSPSRSIDRTSSLRGPRPRLPTGPSSVFTFTESPQSGLIPLPSVSDH